MSRSCPVCGKRYPDKVAFCGYDGTITIQNQDAADFDSRLGQRLGGYLVVARVADGAMGRVYEGRHPETKERVAIKVLHEDTLKDQVSIERFKREYETASEMLNPHIIQVLEFGDTPDGSYFMTMEYLQGEELRKLLDREGILAIDRVVRIISQVAVALDYAHSFGFIHRDLKPNNIFLCQSPDGDVVRILDFGSVKLQMETGAKLTALGTTLGSPYYMSPEQARGALDVDQRSDVFALSAILYEMVTGKVAFGAPNVAQILVKIMTESPTPASSLNPNVPQSMDDVIDKGLRKDKERRYPSAIQFANALIEALGLAGSAASWANRPLSEIGAALGEAAPKPPKPFGAVSVPPRIDNPEREDSSLPASPQPRVSPPRIDSMVDGVPVYITRSGKKSISSFLSLLLVLVAISGFVVIGALISYLLS
ncbi:MAG: serine/threonine protein kinase [Deltaproteobacteria bacterium]|nr:serine/threonine protein kinase [Deltaproteobacteria bacterium]